MKRGQSIFPNGPSSVRRTPTGVHGDRDLSLEGKEQKLHLEEVCDGRCPAQHGKESVPYIMDEKSAAGQPQSLGHRLGSHLQEQEEGMQVSMVCCRTKRASPAR